MTDERGRELAYDDMLRLGYSDAEAREEAWPEPREVEAVLQLPAPGEFETPGYRQRVVAFYLTNALETYFRDGGDTEDFSISVWTDTVEDRAIGEAKPRAIRGQAWVRVTGKAAS